VISRILQLVVLFILSPVLAQGVVCTSPITGTAQCTGFEQYGITMTFSAEKTCGTFVMGDPWCVGNTTVNSVSPGWTGTDHGSMKNPVAGAGQAFCSRGDDYEASMVVTYPVSLVATDSLVASISETTAIDDWQGLNAGSSDFTEHVLILSIVAEAPAAGTFRPAPTDRSQHLYTTSQVRTDLLLLEVSSGMTLPTFGGFASPQAYFERGVERPWILFGYDYQSRTIHPKQNMSDYHGEIGPFLGKLYPYLMSDQVTTPMLHGFLQIAIDYLYADRDSANWAATLVIGGVLLDEPDMYNYWINNPCKGTGRDHEKFFYPDEKHRALCNDAGSVWSDVIDYYDSVYPSSLVTRGQTWTGYVHPVSGKVPMFSKQVTVAQANTFLDHLVPSEWDCDGGLTINQCYSWDYYVKYDVHPLIGMLLATQLIGETSGLNTKAMIAHDPAWDYADRWMGGDVWLSGNWNGTGRTMQQEVEFQSGYDSGPGYLESAGSTLNNQMWDAYRDINFPVARKTRYRLGGSLVIGAEE